ncbi:MAG: 1-(5-phosphoribosyl)-5-[(5-phosphoribosylamino)methylideneamino]imidazole-4-carboxamide isomerase [Alphaproteobacteria bacterium]|jgi:phosphoribosylformimino-5-aminoimidazole carboxamide ribotide isomerase|nr:1-(5-phosphoribosyl)-5-[(5-phosphoribosylamino)methylideneamino]imidazole-4-carboxamide isomerase [Alphaproteobacteria bacterium]MDP6813580.1 1-(5-phosphoribosyl)-5-[(5-phosphoribosylamino)methylideneamino]imidazole-4-carboxamide isomerase [Alphaproteobacteria bacterium]
MILYPAIDLKDGQCVRLLRGEMSRATVFNDDPAVQARSFEAAGCQRLHLVDLNGAVEGRPVNGEAVAAILRAVSLPVQLGGGIRDQATIEGWLERGISRVILGTLALRQPDLVRQLCRTHPGRIAVGIDGRGGRVAVEGWVEQSEMPVRELARRFEDAGAAAIIYTDIDRDGAMRGHNVDDTVALAEALSTPVIASGGVTDLDDLRALRAVAHRGIEGVIVGRALYDGAIDLPAALDVLGGDEEAAAC